MVIHSTFRSFQWNSWLSETVLNCLLSHFTLSFLQHHRGFENWCSGQLFMHVYRSGDLVNNQGLVFSLQWPEIEKIEKTYKTITFGITRCFLKTLQGKNQLTHLVLFIILIFFKLHLQNFKRTNDYKGYKFNCFFKLQYIFLLPWIKLCREFTSLLHLQI